MMPCLQARREDTKGKTEFLLINDLHDFWEAAPVWVAPEDVSDDHDCLLNHIVDLLLYEVK